MNNKIIIKFGLVIIGCLFVVGCAKTTEHIAAVSDFRLENYAGTWYEIARLPHSFEKGLVAVTATYEIQPDGRMSILNKGFNPEKKIWKESKAVGRPAAGKAGTGELEVSFMWPIWVKYRVVMLEPKYQYALVTGGTMDYFWVLSRTPHMDKKLLESLLEQAGKWGFDTRNIITGVQPESR